MLHPEEEATPHPPPAPPVDGALVVWDPWLISMYVDAMRNAAREARWLH